MVCLGFEQGAAGWKARMNPLSYGGTPIVLLMQRERHVCALFLPPFAPTLSLSLFPHCQLPLYKWKKVDVSFKEFFKIKLKSKLNNPEGIRLLNLTLPSV